MTASRFIVRATTLSASLALAGCGLASLMPFRGDDTGHVPPPENAVQYRCAKNASFYLRTLSDGAMWVIYNDRQIRLDKDAANPKRFSNGVAVLEMDGAGVTLSDGPQINYSACAIPAKK
ncbi:MAG TPA: hypothetical protein VH105_11400 [Burkholderiales bacterium]|jgi:hypothetical protein|nr:hypothetical protein [Burkholderiales bacterium]